MRKWNGKLPRPELTNNFWPRSLWEEQHTDTGSDVTCKPGHTLAPAKPSSPARRSDHGK